MKAIQYKKIRTLIKENMLIFTESSAFVLATYFLEIMCDIELIYVFYKP